MGSRHTDIGYITDAIRDRILRGIYPQGAKLSENSISEEFSCSRTPVREAFKRLETDHLVEILPHSGTYVRIPTLDEAIEITEIRAYLECLAFRLACERKAPCETLELLVDQMEAILRCPEVDFVLFGKVHYHFHTQIVELSGNRMLQDVYSKLNIAFSALFYNTMKPDEIETTIREHRLIVEYLRSGEVKDASYFMYSHLWEKRERLIASRKES